MNKLDVSMNRRIMGKAVIRSHYQMNGPVGQPLISRHVKVAEPHGPSTQDSL